MVFSQRQVCSFRKDTWQGLGRLFIVTTADEGHSEWVEASAAAKNAAQDHIAHRMAAHSSESSGPRASSAEVAMQWVLTAPNVLVGRAQRRLPGSVVVECELLEGGTVSLILCVACLSQEHTKGNFHTGSGCESKDPGI